MKKRILTAAAALALIAALGTAGVLAAPGQRQTARGTATGFAIGRRTAPREPAAAAPSAIPSVPFRTLKMQNKFPRSLYKFRRAGYNITIPKRFLARREIGGALYVL